MVTTFKILKGTKCHVSRRRAVAEWRPYVTTRPLTFLSYGVADGGGKWLFVSGDWMLKVSPKNVVGRAEKVVEDRRGGYGGDYGRGVSRRRNMRAAKRR